MIKYKILIISNSDEVIKQVESYFVSKNCAVYLTDTFSDGISFINTIEPDIIISKLVLSDGSGYDLCKFVKENKKYFHIPILFISSDRKDVIPSLKLGAEDCLIEPLSAEEIVVKTESILRRTSLIPPDEIIKKGCIIINVGKYEVRVNNKIINLTPKEFDLLYVLVRANGRVLSRSYLLERIWGYRYIRETRTVDVHIRRLRKKLGKTAGRRIITVAGIGYKFE